MRSLIVALIFLGAFQCSGRSDRYGDEENAPYTEAAGRNARAEHEGSFVWSDSRTNITSSTTTNEVIFEAQNGLTLLGGAFKGDGSQLSGVSSSTTNDMDVYIFVGQSNMMGSPANETALGAWSNDSTTIRFTYDIATSNDGTNEFLKTLSPTLWGPYVPALGLIEQQTFGPKVGIVVVAASGISMHTDLNPSGPGTWYTNLTNLLAAVGSTWGTTYNTLNYRGLYMMQGEADAQGTEAQANAWATNFYSMVTNVETVVGSELDVTVGVIAGSDSYTYLSNVQAAQRDPRWDHFETEDLVRPDDVHFDGDALMRVAERFLGRGRSDTFASERRKNDDTYEMTLRGSMIVPAVGTLNVNGDMQATNATVSVSNLTVQTMSASTRVSADEVAYTGDSTDYAEWNNLDAWSLYYNGTKMHQISSASAKWNIPGSNYFFNIEGDTDSGLFYAQGSTDRIGIGTTSPASKLEVDGVVTADRLDGGVQIFTEAHAASHTLTASECYGSVYYVTAAATLTLPAVADGMNLTVITLAAAAVSIDANASDLINLDGTALDDGDKITSGSTAGEVAVLTYRDATGWVAVTDGWTDGGP